MIEFSDYIDDDKDFKEEITLARINAEHKDLFQYLLKNQLEKIPSGNPIKYKCNLNKEIGIYNCQNFKELRSLNNISINDKIFLDDKGKIKYKFLSPLYSINILELDELSYIDNFFGQTDYFVTESCKNLIIVGSLENPIKTRNVNMSNNKNLKEVFVDLKTGLGNIIFRLNDSLECVHLNSYSRVDIGSLSFDSQKKLSIKSFESSYIKKLNFLSSNIIDLGPLVDANIETLEINNSEFDIDQFDKLVQSSRSILIKNKLVDIADFKERISWFPKLVCSELDFGHGIKAEFDTFNNRIKFL